VLLVRLSVRQTLAGDTDDALLGAIAIVNAERSAL
jgi:hypothetical protein